MKKNPRDPYREWSYSDRCDARWNPDQRDNCRRYDADSESSDRAYAAWRNGGEYRDPDPRGRFH